MKNTLVAIFVLAVLAVSACTPSPQAPATGDIPALIRALEDEDPDVRSAAVVALGEIGPGAADAVPALLLALEDEDPGVRSAAANALEQIGQ